MKDNDAISIITICFNNKEELLNTIDSVDSQNTPPFEHWIIDGSSNEEIKLYLENNEQPVYRKWICEPDNGIGDAFNKGIKNATGDIINLLNSGDTFYDETVTQFVQGTFQTQKNITWLHSKYCMHRGGGWIIIGKAFDKNQLYKGMRRVCHQTMFVKRAVYEKYGEYNNDEKIAMDYDYLCRMADEPFFFSEKILAKFIPDGISNTQYLKALTNQKTVYEKHFKPTIKTDLWIIRQKILYYILQSPLGNFIFSIKKGLKLENW